MKIDVFEGKRSYDYPSVKLENNSNILDIQVLDNLDLVFSTRGSNIFLVDKSNSLVYDIFARLYTDILELCESDLTISDAISLASSEGLLEIRKVGEEFVINLKSTNKFKRIIISNKDINKILLSFYKRLINLDRDRMDQTIDEYMYELKRVRK